jgi:hypothetical protein
VPASIAVPPLSRRTIIVETVHPLLADSQVATSVASDVPIVSERTMAWPGSFATWFESHGGIGAVETALKWGIGGGLAGTVRAGETYLLLANPQATAAAVRLTFLRQSGAPVVKTVAVPAGARLNVPVATTAPELVNESFAVLVEATNGVPISVERSTYWTVGGEVWAAGTDSRAIKIP